MLFIYLLKLTRSTLRVEDTNIPYSNSVYTQQALDALLRMAMSLPIDDHLRVYFINSLSSIKQKLEQPFFKFPNESYCGYSLTNN